ncbi:MarR family winged helix-turn-helix transcriptional regulator [Methylobacterium platani]|nr:MarR family winged helix-turn-helix transcriptional regulator [Methylobacterium platani]
MRKKTEGAGPAAQRRLAGGGASNYIFVSANPRLTGATIVSGRSSGDLFGSFLRVMQEPGNQGHASARASYAAPRVDALSTVVKSIGRSGPATIVDLAQHTGLTMDMLARTLQNGVETGLIAPTAKQSDKAYDLTTLGRKVL